jgi:hypothetical protein
MNVDALLTVGFAGAVIVAYQALYRCFLRRPKKQRLIFMLKRSAVSLSCYTAAVAFLRNSELSTIRIAVLSAVTGIAVAQVTVRRARRDSVMRPNRMTKARQQLHKTVEFDDVLAPRTEKFRENFPNAVT